MGSHLEVFAPSTELMDVGIDRSISGLQQEQGSVLGGARVLGGSPRINSSSENNMDDHRMFCDREFQAELQRKYMPVILIEDGEFEAVVEHNAVDDEMLQAEVQPKHMPLICSDGDVDEAMGSASLYSPEPGEPQLDSRAEQESSPAEEIYGLVVAASCIPEFSTTLGAAVTSGELATAIAGVASNLASGEQTWREITDTVLSDWAQTVDNHPAQDALASPAEDIHELVVAASHLSRLHSELDAANASGELAAVIAGLASTLASGEQTWLAIEAETCDSRAEKPCMPQTAAEPASGQNDLLFEEEAYRVCHVKRKWSSVSLAGPALADSRK